MLGLELALALVPLLGWVMTLNWAWFEIASLTEIGHGLVPRLNLAEAGSQRDSHDLIETKRAFSRHDRARQSRAGRKMIKTGKRGEKG